MEEDKPKLWRKRDRSEVFAEESDSGAVKLFVEYHEDVPVWDKVSLRMAFGMIEVYCSSDPVFMDLLLEDFDSRIKSYKYDDTTVQVIRETLQAIPPFDETFKTLEEKHIPHQYRNLEIDRYRLKAICNGYGSFFVNTTTMTTFQYGKEIIISKAFILVPDVFKSLILPLLSAEEVARLEQTGSEFRELIINSNVWELLFARLKEIYDPGIFSKQMIGHYRKEMRNEHSHIAYLEDISDPKYRGRPYYKKTDPPYWKQLYEYQMKNNFAKMRPLVRSFMTMPKCCGFYRGRIFKWIHAQGCVITYPLQQQRQEFMPYDLDGFALKVFLHSNVLKNEEQKKNIEDQRVIEQKELDWFMVLSTGARRVDTISLYEFNNKYLLLSFGYSDTFKKDVLQKTVFDGTHYFVICEYDKPNTPVFKDPTKVTECGLVGDTGYYYREVDHWYRDPDRWNIISEKERYVLVDHDQNIRINFDHHLLFYPCYSTPSNCFLLFNTRDETCEWHMTQRGGTFLIADDIPFNPHPNQTKMYTHSNKWLVWTMDTNRIAIKRADTPHFKDLELKFDPDFEIGAGCIVGDRIYLFQSRHWIVVVNLEDAYDRDLLELRKRDTYKIYPITQPFDYVRMTFLGPALCQYGGNNTPYIGCINPNDKSVQLVACQVCQIPVKFMCSECKTPACSDKHLKCCK